MHPRALFAAFLAVLSCSCRSVPRTAASIRSRCGAFLVIFFLAAVPALPQGHAQVELLTYLPHTEAKPSALGRTLSGREVEVDVSPLLDRSKRPFRLHLPNGEQYLVTGTHEALRSSKVFTWQGTLWVSGERQGQIVISVQNGAIAGKIYTKEVTYLLSPLGNGRAILAQLDDSEPLPCGIPAEDDVRKGNVGSVSSPPSFSAYAEDGSVIDVLVFYTTEAREAAGGQDEAESIIRMAISDANLAFQNSDVRTRFNPVGIQELEYEETEDGNRDLDWLQGDDTVAEVRNELAADLVGMVVSEMDSCGIGNLMNPDEVGAVFAPEAFQVTALDCLDNHTLAHEFGHNMGAHHNIEDAGTHIPAFPYGYGYHVDGSFRTIMSYGLLAYCPNGCHRIPHFSNPVIEFDGEPTGVPDEQDNHRVLNQTAVHVANFRVPLPRTPENVQASDGTFTDRIRVTWNPVDRAERYTLYRSTSTTGTKTVVASSLSSTSYDDTSASEGQIYYYWVKALNSAGSSEISISDTGYRRIPPPVAPTGVLATDGTYTDRVRITWNAVSGATTYSVFRATSTGGTKTTLATSLTSTSFDDTSAVAGTTYYYWVRASSSSGSSDFSSYNTGYRAVAPPVAPTGVSASDGSYTDRVRITWNAVSGATTYSVFRATSTGGTKTTLATSLTSTSFDDTSAVAGATYYYWVRASSSSGSSDFSSYNTGYRAVAPPAAPTGVSATDGTYTDRVRITWNAVSGATYSVFRATSTSGSKTTLATSLTSTSFDDTSAVAGTTYYYWVKALNSSGSSDFSSYNTGYRAVAPPAAPTGVSATDGTYTDRVRITWNAVSGATYSVFRATSTSGSKTTLATSLTSTSFDDTSAVAGTTYYYWVRSTNSAGPSDFSSYNIGYRAVAPPAAPTGVSATDGTYTDRVRITWNAVSGAAGYVVYRATSTSGTKTVLAHSLASTSFDDTSAVAGTTYYYWVKASNSSGSSGLSSYNTGWRR